MTKKDQKLLQPPDKLTVEEQRRRYEEEELRGGVSLGADTEESSAHKPRRRASRPKQPSKFAAFVKWGTERAPELTRKIDEGLRYVNNTEDVALMLVFDASVSSRGGTVNPGLLEFIEKEGREKLKDAKLSFRDKVEESTLKFLHPKYVGRALLELKAVDASEAKTRIQIAAFFHELPAAVLIKDADDKLAVEECFYSGKTSRSSKPDPEESLRLRNKASDRLHDSLEVLYAVTLASPSSVATTRGPKNMRSFLIHPAMIIFEEWPAWTS